MSNNTKILQLLGEGIKLCTLNKMSDTDIDRLHKKLVNEQDSEKVDQLDQKVTKVRQNLAGLRSDMEELGEEDIEVDEEFRSKAQQGYFWARCEEEGKNSKWCKMAKEFSDDTDFKNLPDKVKEIEESLVSLILKNEGMITKKDLLEQETAPVKPTVKPGTKPERFSPYRSKPGTSPKPKAGDTKTAPTKPTVKPGTKPERFTPYRSKPGTSPKPKAGEEGGLPEFLKFNNLNITFRDE